MASTREERMHQRLRGSQRRQVKDVDFGLTFAPAPVLVQPIPSLPPTTRRSPRRSLELAPQPSPRPTSSTSRARSQPPSAIPGEENIQPTAIHNTVDANTSAKRRKLNTDNPSTSTRSTRSSLPVPHDVYGLNEEEQLVAAAADTTNGSIEQPMEIQQMQEQDTSTSFDPQTAATPPPTTAEEEVMESPSHAPGSGHRTRIINRSAKQSSQLQNELQIYSTVQIEPIGSPTPQRKRKRDGVSQKGPDTGRSRRTRRSQMNGRADEIDELSPDQPKRGRRRRSSIQRESLEETLEEAIVEESASKREAAEDIEDAEATAVLGKNRGRRVSRRALSQPSPDLDEPSEQPLLVAKKQRSRLHPISSPAQQRHPKSTNQKAVSNPPKQTSKKQIRTGSPIPITVHRLTKGPIYDEDESDADILNSDIPFAKRGGVNVIDTLNQVCVEVIESALETLQNSQRNTRDPALKREYRHKYRVVETFGRELSTRLLDHTINLDNMSSLEKRIREEQTKRLALRQEISRVKAERHQVALRMDEIRIKHEMESGAAQDRDTLNTAVHDIELAVERGRQKNPNDPANGPLEMVGTELLLKRIAGEVSNNGDSGGMLKQIKDFNAFLERTAIALESRKT